MPVESFTPAARRMRNDLFSVKLSCLTISWLLLRLFFASTLSYQIWIDQGFRHDDVPNIVANYDSKVDNVIVVSLGYS